MKSCKLHISNQNHSLLPKLRYQYHHGPAILITSNRFIDFLINIDIYSNLFCFKLSYSKNIRKCTMNNNLLPP